MTDKHTQVQAQGRLSVALLRSENERLKQQLEGLWSEARLNDEKMRRFDRMERRLVESPTLAALIALLLQEYREVFQLDAVTLLLVDSHSEVRALMGDAAIAAGLLLQPDDRLLQALFGAALRPVLGAAVVAGNTVFDGVDAALASVALLPLVQRGQLMGSLNLGSCDAQRFAPGSSTDFLQRLAAIAAVCLHNALATERLKLAGLTDALTSVHNRRYFEARCLEEVQSARRSKLPLVCLFIDVDRFKNLNDTLGHATGDHVLRYVARLIKAQLRGNDVVARYGGEEFVVLLPATPLARGVETAERIRRVIAAQSIAAPGADEVRVTVSLGVSLCRDGQRGDDARLPAQDMLARADQAVYVAKDRGRNQVVCLDPL